MSFLLKCFLLSFSSLFFLLSFCSLSLFFVKGSSRSQLSSGSQRKKLKKPRQAFFDSAALSGFETFHCGQERPRNSCVLKQEVRGNVLCCCFIFLCVVPQVPGDGGGVGGARRVRVPPQRL